MTSVVGLDDRGDRVMMAVDPSRTVRALSLDVQPLGDGAYIVSGGAEPHQVTTSEEPWRCDCMDAQYGRGACKHAVAVYFARRLAPAVRDALRAAVGSA